ncbi:hypothetical protein QBC35DRAFT_45586 [Podospora australis]|uniref:Ubiquitin carboxyl-terminal hydrolase n=1 Tax=Podospora australis TaxID=1536484 RepID=A0AAN6X152_9PEZI|nr:hypothetical protein QBC35DRAFT_45586 [Podospora australis]
MAGPTSVLRPAGVSHLAGTDGHANGGANGGKRPLPHIDDIILVEDDLIDPHAPIETVLTRAETYLRQAGASKDFLGRPDLALKDYIRANVILLDKIKKNKGWVSLQRDNRKHYEHYQRLLRQANSSHGEYEAIKQEIKADNARTGIQPAKSRPDSAAPSAGKLPDHVATNGRGTGESTKAGHVNVTSPTRNRENGTLPRSPLPQDSPKTKPAVQPKPQRLHGNALNSAGTETASSAKARELSERFANLRMSTSRLGQDPRIRTQSITSPTTITSNQTPPQSPFSKGALSDSVVDLPKMPDAIYNPPRGTVSQEAAELPSSTPRSMFTRTGSTSSIGATKIVKSSPVTEVYSTAQTFGATPSLAEEDTIGVDQLIALGKTGITVLFVDIRGRERFDSGHIKTKDVICIEPEVLTRDHISADQISDSMVLATAEEHQHFQIRGQYDLVVFYDQSSRRVNQNPSPYDSEDLAIQGFIRALKDYDYSNSRCKSGPKLLRGGLDEWTRVFGPTALERSPTSVTAKRASHLVTPVIARSAAIRRKTFATRPIQNAQEAEQWEKDFANFLPAKTYDDFLRRYPAIPGYQESMMESNGDGVPPRFHQDTLLRDSLLSPPARPAPAVPRTSYSGLAESSDDHVLSARPAVVGQKKRPFRVGLYNPGNFCYANSAVQALFATPGFNKDLLTGKWKEDFVVPRTLSEQIDNPQLMMKCIQSLFYFLNLGNHPWIELRTFMNYVLYIHRKAKGLPNDNSTFGTKAQHDTEEFLEFIFEIIGDETNKSRDQHERQPNKKYENVNNGGENIMQWWWDRWNPANDSIIDKYFRAVKVTTDTCDKCHYTEESYEKLDVVLLKFRNGKDGQTLESLLHENFGHDNSDRLDGSCDKCHDTEIKKKTWKNYFARMPDRLIFCFQRFQNKQNRDRNEWEIIKLRTKVEFPINGLDLTRFAAPGLKDRGEGDHHLTGPFIYDCYAVIQHVGKTTKSGHYVAYVKDDLSTDNTAWWKCNDTETETLSVTGDPNEVTTQELYKVEKGEPKAETYVVFYQRRGT